MKHIVALLLALIPLQLTAAVSAWESFEIRQNRIFIPVKVNGVATHLMFDSGASVNAISTSYLDKHGAGLVSGGSMKLTGVFGVEDKPTYSNITLELWGSEFKQDGLVALDLGEDVGILLGTAFLQQFVIQIDYPNQRLRLLTRDEIDLRKARNIKGRMLDGMVNVKVGLNGQKDLWLLLDTGADTGIVTRRLYAEQYGWLEQFETQSFISSGANRSTVMDGFTMPFVEMGPFVIEEVPTFVPAKGHSTTFGRNNSKATGSHIRGHKQSGVLGYELLKHFVLTIDFKKGYVHLDAP